MPVPTTQEGSSRWLWWLAGLATLAVVLAAGGAAWYHLAGRTVWTDGRDIRRDDAEVRLRRVIWTAPRAVGPNVNTGSEEYEPALADDGRAMFFVRGQPGRDADIYVCLRDGNAWTPPAPLAAVNTPHDELGPRPSPDGRFLLFYSNRPGGLGQYDLWAAKRTGDGWGEPFNLGPAVNSKHNEYGPAMTPDGRRLIFASNRGAAAKADGADVPWQATIRQGEVGDYDLYVCERTGAPGGAPVASRPGTGPATTQPGAAPALAFNPARELEGVNTPHHEGACCVSPAGDFLYFASNRSGSLGGFDLYRARLADGRCQDVVNLGPELNTSANEMDPHLAMGGFEIYFSSDRPGGAGGYDVLSARSREVFASRQGVPPPQLSWSLWALIVALAVLIPLLLFLRAAGYRHLSLLQKCIAVSLLLHVGLTMLLSLFFIYRPLLQHVAEAAGLTTAVNLEVGPEVQMRMQIRQQITDLPVTELPVRDPMLTEAARPELAQIAPAPPEAAELNVPHAQVRPAPMTVQPESPRLTRPAPAPPSVSLPAPSVRSEEPLLRPVAESPVVQAEPSPQPAPAQPVLVPREPTRTEAPSAAPTELALAAAPARPQTDSLAVLAAIDRPVVPDAPKAAPAPTPAPTVAPDVPVPQVAPVGMASSATTAPAVEALEAVAPPAPTASPRAEPAPLPTLAVPAKVQVGQSLAVAAEVWRPPVPAAASPVAIDMRAATDAPEIRLPVLATPATVSAEPVPLATSIRPPGELEARPLSGTKAPSPAAEALAGLAAPSPARLEAASLVRPSMHLAGRPPWAGPAPDRLAPAARVTPLVPLALPGPSTSPDAFFQRCFEQRQKFVEAMGGSKESEAAVARALAYLARQQEPDGRWAFDPARKESGRRGKNDIAITGLAALCFLAADYTPAKPGPYQECIRKAVEHIVAQQEDNGDLRAGGDMYSHAIAALAVTEAAVMTGEPRYRLAAIKGGRFIVNSQNRSSGGWRYQPGDDGDTSVFGWQILALHALENMGIRIPSETRSLAIRWLDRVGKPPHRVLAGYQGPNPTPRMTAEALISRVFLGQQLTEAQVGEACGYLEFSKAEGKADYYYWYYGSLALMQLQNEAWRRWSAEMQRTLLRLQERDGSWNEKLSKYGPRGGRIYATALSALSLQVFYRYLPEGAGDGEGGRQGTR